MVENEEHLRSLLIRVCAYGLALAVRALGELSAEARRLLAAFDRVRRLALAVRALRELSAGTAVGTDCNTDYDTDLQCDHALDL